MMHADRQIPGWFPEVNRNHLIWLMREHDVKVVLEIGAFLGKSTVFFAERCEVVYSVDHWSIDCLTSEDEKRFAGELGLPRDFRMIWEDNLKQALDNSLGNGSHFGKVSPVRPDSPFLESFPLFRGGRLSDTPHPPDLCYIDGDHTYEAVKRDIEKYGPLAKKIICGDDYGVADGVTQAVLEVFGSVAGFGGVACTAGPFWWVVK
jgi:hypothetical protein